MLATQMHKPQWCDVQQAAIELKPFVHRTPVLRSASIDRMLGQTLYFKCENLQRTGSFKFRGATNALLSLAHDVLSQGVATHSSGNHGAALALAAKTRGIRASVVMPNNSVVSKIHALRSYGAEIIHCEPTQKAREETLDTVLAQKGGSFVHPYENGRVIAGQGTAAFELCQEVPNLEALVVPVGGGGLLAGTALVGEEFGMKVYAAEPRGADDTYSSLKAGKRLPMQAPDTLCDGLRTSLGKLPYDLIRSRVEEVILVDDPAVVEAMRLIWERMKMVVEPSSATVLAALFKRKLPHRRIGVILSGGNVDLGALPF
jgi:threonine dehydratase